MLMPRDPCASNHIPVLVSLEHTWFKNVTFSQCIGDDGLHTCVLTMLAMSFTTQLAYAFFVWVDVIL